MTAEAPVVAGRLYGLRTWVVGPDGVLRSPFRSEPWTPGSAMRAHCSGHRAPDARCSCGLYGLHPTAAGLAQLPTVDADGVVGIVEVWGEVELHESGFRAQFARPYALALPRGARRADRARLRRAAERYGIPLLQGDAAALAAHCEAHDLGFSAETVAGLLGAAVLREARRVRRRRWRPSIDLVMAIGCVAVWLVAPVGIVAALVAAFGPAGRPVAPPLAAERHLRVVADALLDDTDGTATYVAVVRNEDRWLSARGIWAQGSVDTAAGRTSLGPAASQDLRPSLGPGETGLLVDTLPDADTPARAIHVRLRAHVFRAATRGLAVGFGPVRLDRRRCLARAVVRSDRPRRTLDLYVVSTRGRRFVSAEPATIGPLVRGASLQYLLRVDPRVCAHAGRLMAIASVAAAGRPSTQRPT